MDSCKRLQQDNKEISQVSHMFLSHCHFDFSCLSCLLLFLLRIFRRNIWDTVETKMWNTWGSQLSLLRLERATTKQYNSYNGISRLQQDNKETFSVSSNTFSVFTLFFSNISQVSLCLLLFLLRNFRRNIWNAVDTKMWDIWESHLSLLSSGKATTEQYNFPMGCLLWMVDLLWMSLARISSSCELLITVWLCFRAPSHFLCNFSLALRLQTDWLVIVLYKNVLWHVTINKNYNYVSITTGS